MSAPEPDLRRHLLGDGDLIAGDHLHLMPICRAVAMVASASSRGGSNSGSTPRNCQSPSVVGPGHAQRAEAAGGEVVDRLRRRLVLHCVGIGDQGQDHLRRALGDLERLSVRAP